MSSSEFEKLERAVMDAVRDGSGNLVDHMLRQGLTAPARVLCRYMFLSMTGQLHVLGLVDEVKRSLEKSLEILTPETAYVRDDLQRLLDDVQLLLVKMQDEEELRHVREVVG